MPEVFEEGDYVPLEVQGVMPEKFWLLHGKKGENKPLLLCR